MPVKIQKHIEIVRSSVPSLSSLSLPSCDAIYKVLQEQYVRVGVSTVNTEEDLQELIDKKPDLAFMGMNYLPKGQAKLWISASLEQHGINYTGSRWGAHELGLDKALAKQKVLSAGLNTAPFAVIKPGDSTEALPFKFPLFVKPTSLGGGDGIDAASVVKDQVQLKSKLKTLITDRGVDALVEEYLSGREFSVAILTNELSGELRAWPIEIVAERNARGNRLLDAQTKAANIESVSLVDGAYIKARVVQLAVRAFRALGARDYGRIDIRLNAKGVPQFLEINLIPSLIEGYGFFPKACLLNSSLTYEAMILVIVQLGLSRPSPIAERTQISELAQLMP